MMNWQKNILSSIGETPLVEFQRLGREFGCRIFGKVESLNPSGSIKARTALKMIEDAEAQNLLKPESIIVEATSGNQGIALAMIGAVKGYKVKIVMPENMSLERRKLIQAYGAEVVLAPAGANIQEAIEGSVSIMNRLAEEDANVFLPRQFENLNNSLAHREGTGYEIITQLDGIKVDAFVSGFGTGGTITGVGEALRKVYPALRIFAAEPDQAAILSGLPMGHHNQQGIGDGLIPPIMNVGLVDELILVSDAQAEETARQLARQEGLLSGVSSGTNVYSALEIAKKLGPGHTIVTLLPDSGERYLSAGLYE